MTIPTMQHKISRVYREKLLDFSAVSNTSHLHLIQHASKHACNPVEILNQVPCDDTLSANIKFRNLSLFPHPQINK